MNLSAAQFSSKMWKLLKKRRRGTYKVTRGGLGRERVKRIKGPPHYKKKKAFWEARSATIERGRDVGGENERRVGLNLVLGQDVALHKSRNWIATGGE